MFKFNFVFFLLFLLNFEVFAQKTDSLPKKRKWEIALDLRQLLSYNQYNIDYLSSFLYSDLSRNFDILMFKRHFSNNQALRLRLNMGFWTSSSNPKNYMQSRLNASLAIGYEWQKPMGKFQLLYGVETELSLDKYWGETTSNNVLQFSNNGKSVRLGANAFLGVKYFILPRLAVSAESMLKYSTVQYYSRSEYFGSRPDVNRLSESNSRVNYLTTYSLYFLNLSYYF